MRSMAKKSAKRPSAAKSKASSKAGKAGTTKKPAAKPVAAKAKPAAVKAKPPATSSKAKPPATSSKKAATTPSKAGSATNGSSKTASKSSDKASNARGKSAEPSAEAKEAIEAAIEALEDNDFETAAGRFLVAAKLVPDDWRLPNEAAICFYRLERYDDAVRCCDLALAAAPEEVQVHANKGLMLALANRDDEALAAFQAALEVDPTYPSAFLEIGKLLQKRGDHEDALEYFTTALAHETMRSTFDVSGETAINPHLIALVHVNKARILLGPLDRETEGLEHVAALWTAVKDDQRMLLVARELAPKNPARARRVLDVLLAVKPDHEAALAFRDRLDS
jgi:tetratricopeptide (TPR) repeat protein